jgi:hypothetical protein
MSKENSFQIGNKAETLYNEIFDITTSKKHMPVRFVRLAHRMEDYALEIHSNVYDANALRADISAHKQKRFSLQTSAIANCDKLESLITYTRRKELISDSVCEKVVALISDIRNMTLSWRKL